MTKPGWYAFDLDGTLAVYASGQWPKIGAPIAPMIDRLRAMLEAGHDCRIMTARVCSDQTPEERNMHGRAVELWCLEHVGRVLPVTCEKDFSMLLLYDDRAVAVEKNTGRLVSPDPVIA